MTEPIGACSNATIIEGYQREGVELFNRILRDHNLKDSPINLQFDVTIEARRKSTLIVEKSRLLFKIAPSDSADASGYTLSQLGTFDNLKRKILERLEKAEIKVPVETVGGVRSLPLKQALEAHNLKSLSHSCVDLEETAYLLALEWVKFAKEHGNDSLLQADHLHTLTFETSGAAVEGYNHETAEQSPTLPPSPVRAPALFRYCQKGYDWKNDLDPVGLRTSLLPHYKRLDDLSVTPAEKLKNEGHIRNQLDPIRRAWLTSMSKDERRDFYALLEGQSLDTSVKRTLNAASRQDALYPFLWDNAKKIVFDNLEATQKRMEGLGFKPDFTPGVRQVVKSLHHVAKYIKQPMGDMPALLQGFMGLQGYEGLPEEPDVQRLLFETLLFAVGAPEDEVDFMMEMLWDRHPDESIYIPQQDRIQKIIQAMGKIYTSAQTVKETYNKTWDQLAKRNSEGNVVNNLDRLRLFNDLMRMLPEQVLREGIPTPECKLRFPKLANALYPNSVESQEVVSSTTPIDATLSDSIKPSETPSLGSQALTTVLRAGFFAGLVAVTGPVGGALLTAGQLLDSANDLKKAIGKVAALKALNVAGMTVDIDSATSQVQAEAIGLAGAMLTPFLPVGGQASGNFLQRIGRGMYIGGRNAFVISTGQAGTLALLQDIPQLVKAHPNDYVAIVTGTAARMGQYVLIGTLGGAAGGAVGTAVMGRKVTTVSSQRSGASPSQPPILFADEAAAIIPSMRAPNWNDEIPLKLGTKNDKGTIEYRNMAGSYRGTGKVRDTVTGQEVNILVVAVGEDHYGIPVSGVQWARVTADVVDAQSGSLKPNRSAYPVVASAAEAPVVETRGAPLLLPAVSASAQYAHAQVAKLVVMLALIQAAGRRGRAALGSPLRSGLQAAGGGDRGRTPTTPPAPPAPSAGSPSPSASSPALPPPVKLKAGDVLPASVPVFDKNMGSQAEGDYTILLRRAVNLPASERKNVLFKLKTDSSGELVFWEPSYSGSPRIFRTSSGDPTQLRALETGYKQSDMASSRGSIFTPIAPDRTGRAQYITAAVGYDVPAISYTRNEMLTTVRRPSESHPYFDSISRAQCRLMTNRSNGEIVLLDGGSTSGGAASPSSNGTYILDIHGNPIKVGPEGVVLPVGVDQLTVYTRIDLTGPDDQPARGFVPVANIRIHEDTAAQAVYDALQNSARQIKLSGPRPKTLQELRGIPAQREQEDIDAFLKRSPTHVDRPEQRESILREAAQLTNTPYLQLEGPIMKDPQRIDKSTPGSSADVYTGILDLSGRPRQEVAIKVIKDASHNLENFVLAQMLGSQLYADAGSGQEVFGVTVVKLPGENIPRWALITEKLTVEGKVAERPPLILPRLRRQGKLSQADLIQMLKNLDYSLQSLVMLGIDIRGDYQHLVAQTAYKARIAHPQLGIYQFRPIDALERSEEIALKVVKRYLHYSQQALDTAKDIPIQVRRGWADQFGEHYLVDATPQKAKEELPYRLQRMKGVNSAQQVTLTRFVNDQKLNGGNIRFTLSQDLDTKEVFFTIYQIQNDSGSSWQTVTYKVDPDGREKLVPGSNISFIP